MLGDCPVSVFPHGTGTGNLAQIVQPNVADQVGSRTGEVGVGWGGGRVTPCGQLPKEGHRCHGLSSPFHQGVITRVSAKVGGKGGSGRAGD